MDVRRGCVVLVAVFAAGTVGCVGLLGLDHGVPEEDPEASADASGRPDGPSAMLEGGIDRASGTDVATSQEDSSRGDGVAPDVASVPDVADDRAADAVLTSDATGADGGCRAALQPCQIGTECCSGVCGVGLTCL
jgi:hypothetical protein